MPSSDDIASIRISVDIEALHPIEIHGRNAFAQIIFTYTPNSRTGVDFTDETFIILQAAYSRAENPATVNFNSRYAETAALANDRYAAPRQYMIEQNPFTAAASSTDPNDGNMIPIVSTASTYRLYYSNFIDDSAAQAAIPTGVTFDDSTGSFLFINTANWSTIFTVPPPGFERFVVQMIASPDLFGNYAITVVPPVQETNNNINTQYSVHGVTLWHSDREEADQYQRLWLGADFSSPIRIVPLNGENNYTVLGSGDVNYTDPFVSVSIPTNFRLSDFRSYGIILQRFSTTNRASVESKQFIAIAKTTMFSLFRPQASQGHYFGTWRIYYDANARFHLGMGGTAVPVPPASTLTAFASLVDEQTINTELLVWSIGGIWSFHITFVGY